MKSSSLFPIPREREFQPLPRAVTPPQKVYRQTAADARAVGIHALYTPVRSHTINLHFSIRQHTRVIRSLASVNAHGDAREESFYGSLQVLLQRYAESTGRSDAHVTVLPKKAEAGNPDFRVWDGRAEITGYIEAKHPSEGNLDAIEASEQLRRYRATFPNLILTNFFEFRLYRDGEFVSRVETARGGRGRGAEPGWKGAAGRRRSATESSLFPMR